MAGAHAGKPGAAPGKRPFSGTVTVSRRAGSEAESRRAGSESRAVTPQALAAARIAGRAQRQGRPLPLRDRAQPGAARRLDRARARLGVVAIDTETTSPRPDAGRRCAASRSRSRRTRPATCRSPIARRRRRRRRPVRRRDCARQIPEREALAALKPLLEDRGVLKIGAGPQVRLADVRAARHRAAPYDDTMLMSYVLDAGRCGHGMDALASATSTTRRSTSTTSPAPAKRRSTFDCVAIDKAARICRRGRRHRRCGCGRCSSRAWSPST